MLAIQSLLTRLIALFSRLPDDVIALFARLGVAAVFWRSAQTKVEGFAIDLFHFKFELGLPRLAGNTVDLFRDEYKLPLVPPEFAAPLAAGAEHLFAMMLLLGLGARFAALGVIGMAMTIQFLVYPNSYPDHALWTCACLVVLSKGAGKFSLDHLIAQRFGKLG